MMKEVVVDSSLGQSTFHFPCGTLNISIISRKNGGYGGVGRDEETRRQFALTQKQKNELQMLARIIERELRVPLGRYKMCHVRTVQN